MKWYLGRGLAFDYICLPCANARSRGELAPADDICERCYVFATEDVSEVCGVRGKAEVKVRDEPMGASLVRSSLPSGTVSVLSFAPINGLPGSEWLLLREDRTLVRFDAVSGQASDLIQLKLAPEPDGVQWEGHVFSARLHVSHFGTFAAVVNDYSRHGQVIDLRTGCVTLVLDGGDYYSDKVPFSFAFAEVDGRTVAVHRTQWNRVDLSDPATGALISARGPTNYRRGEPRPAHYLDYFHGALSVSPNSQNILDDGWVWHPVGIPSVWSLQRWARENVWEAEDGPTRLSLCSRAYYWNHAMCWIGDQRVAIEGIGDDDEAMIDGAIIFDLDETNGRSRTPVMTIAGPAGKFFSDGVSLFSANASGFSRWSLADGARTGYLEDFRPTEHHRGAGEFVALAGGELIRWRIG